jgi:hypothetical protein
MIFLYFLFNKNNALAKNERTGKIAEHAHHDIGAFVFIERSKIRAMENKNRGAYLVAEESRYLTIVTLSNQHGTHFVTVLSHYPSHGKCLCEMASPFSLNSK